MTIETLGHSLDDAVRQVLQLFFDISAEFDVVSSLENEENLYIAKAKITLGDRVAPVGFELVQRLNDAGHAVFLYQLGNPFFDLPFHNLEFFRIPQLHLYFISLVQ